MVRTVRGTRRTYLQGIAKRTEMGTTVIPEEWNTWTIGDLFAIKNGLNKAKRFFGTGIPIVNYMDVFERSGLTADSLAGRVTLTPDEIRNYQVRMGDVFFTRTSETVEEIGVASVMLDDPCDTVFSGFVLRARPRDGHLNDTYKQYCFAVRSVRSQIVSNATYTTRALTNGRSLSGVHIAVPPRPEQRAIAAALSDVDELIGSLEALVAKKRAIKQATMQQLLTGRTRLPGFGGEWTERKLGELASIATGTRNNQDKRRVGRYPFFVRSSSVEKIDSFSYDCEAILIPGEGRIGEIFHYVHGRFDVHQRVYVISNAASSVSVRFLYFYMAMHFGPHAMQNTVKATVDSLRLPTFQSFRLPLPPFPEQRAIATTLSDMDVEIAALERRLDKTRAIKQGMMQQLLTGTIRLPIPNDDTEDGHAHDA